MAEASIYESIVVKDPSLNCELLYLEKWLAMEAGRACLLRPESCASSTRTNKELRRDNSLVMTTTRPPIT